MSQLSQQLYIGNIFNALDKRWLQSKKITHVVNATKQIPNAYYENLYYLKLNLQDHPNQKILCSLNKAYHYIDDAIKRGGIVLVHCHAGVSRSASIVIYYIMRKYNLTFNQALQYVKNKRKIVNPNHGFVRQLQYAESKLKLN